MGTISLDPPPSYLRGIPSRLLYGPGYSPDSLFDFLRQHLGVLARPSLADLEDERARRGIRRTDVAIDEPRPRGSCCRWARARPAALRSTVPTPPRRRRSVPRHLGTVLASRPRSPSSARPTPGSSRRARRGSGRDRRDPSASAQRDASRATQREEAGRVTYRPVRHTRFSPTRRGRSIRTGPRCSTPTTSAASRPVRDPPGPVPPPGHGPGLVTGGGRTPARMA